MAGVSPAFFVCVGSVYRLPPVLFAMYAPPGRDRVVVSRMGGTWSLQAFVWRRVVIRATVISRYHGAQASRLESPSRSLDW